MTEASWQDRVDALGRGHYKRYDERTATMLGDGAELLTERWQGDLRRLRDEADGAVGVVAGRLEEFSGIGNRRVRVPARGASRVAVGGPVRGRTRADGCSRARPPTGRDALARLAGSDRDLARLAAALVRVTLTKNAADQVRQAAQDRG